MIEAVLGKLAAGQDLSQEETAGAVDAVMRGECSEGEIGLLLTSLRAKGETVDELWDDRSESEPLFAGWADDDWGAE